MRSSKRTGMPCCRARRTNSSIRLPWLPRATIKESSGRSASSASRTAWIPVSRFMDSRIPCSIESGAKFQDASANGFYRRESFDVRNAVELASPYASRERDAQRMKDFAAGVRQPGFNRGDNFLQPVRIHRAAAQYFCRQYAKNIARAFSDEDLLAFPRSKRDVCVILEYQRQQASERFAILRPWAEQRRGLRQPGGNSFALLAQPTPLAENRGHISGRERIHSGVNFGCRLWKHARSSVPQAQPSSVTIACAAIASPWPIASTPSLVLAFKLIAETEIPNDFANASRMAGKCGPSFGFSVMTIASMCDMRSWRSASKSRTRSKNRKLETSFHFGSVSGKCVPMSPSPAAPS